MAVFGGVKALIKLNLGWMKNPMKLEQLSFVGFFIGRGFQLFQPQVFCKDGYGAN